MYLCIDMFVCLYVCVRALLCVCIYVTLCFSECKCFRVCVSFRLFVAALVIVSVAWIPLIIRFQEGQLFMYIQAVTGYIAPPICSVFLLAIFVPRLNERVRLCLSFSRSHLPHNTHTHTSSSLCVYISADVNLK